MVLYRKYRPQKIADLDLINIRERLTNILSSFYVPHAFLFSGPKGTGKTSSARIVAKVLNCEKSQKFKKEDKPIKKEKREDIEPCNKCQTCKSITEGINMDVLEIDAASNRGIDEIRELREKIKLSPVSNRYKVYIIDEVHMLTNEAFNALLKILEEPPQHAVFILATTRADKLPDTITSRCVKIRFQRAGKDEILHSLKRVVKGEKADFPDKALEKIAGYADGSFRDATKMLEQAFSEGVTDTDKLADIFGKGHFQPREIISLLIEKNTEKILQKIEDLSQAGVDFKYVVGELLDFLHVQLLEKHSVTLGIETEKSIKQLSVKDINNLIKLFLDVYSQLKYAYRPEIPLEVAVVEWCEK